MSSKISVIIISYNQEKYIGQAIDSILAQTFSDFELIVVDDGSVDDTYQIIQNYNDPRIISIRQENSGPSVAINTGISHARGEYIATLGGDDVALPHRLETQLEQIERDQADMVFSLPEIIGANSEVLGSDARPGYFKGNFSSTAELYKKLFYGEIYLCAPSNFCRRSAIEKIGKYHKGLLQFQDFDYWVRACKKGLKVKLYEEPVIQYRSMAGQLSDPKNINRALLDKSVVYRKFFDGASPKLIHEAFGNETDLGASDNPLDLEIDKSFLFLNHPDKVVKTIGVERLIQQFEDDDLYEKLIKERNFDTVDFFKMTTEITADDVERNLSEKEDKVEGTEKKMANNTLNPLGILKKILLFLRSLLMRYKEYILKITDEPPRWTIERAKRHMQYYLEKGDDKRALMLFQGYRKFLPGPIIVTKIEKVLRQLLREMTLVFYDVIHILLEKVRTSIIIRDLRHLLSTSQRKLLAEHTVLLESLYEYSKETAAIVYEAAPEKIYIEKPKIIGSIFTPLSEGNISLPKPYIAELEKVTVFGGSDIVLTRENILLNDDMVVFNTDEFGIKAHQIIFYRSRNKAILRYWKKPDEFLIEEGILLSCGHDPNYFHWLVEVLPKLVFVDEHSQFDEVPLLIYGGLHPNLLEALERINLKKREVIFLDPNVAYQVERLVFPSALSRVIDRYSGVPVFDVDIILSQKWVRKVAALLKKNIKSSSKAPWRKIYIARRKGLRVLQNQKEIEQLLLERGFKIVEDLDQMSLNEQIKLFSQTKIMVAPTGAVLTNMLFCQPDTKVILFMSEHPATNYYFWQNLGLAMEVDVRTVVGKRLFKFSNHLAVHDDYRVDPELVIVALEKPK